MQSLRGIYPACLMHSLPDAIIHFLPEAHSVFPVQAQDQLMHARRILGYSYVFAFYMFGQVMFVEEVSAAQNAINQNLFEDQQQQLEHVVRSTSICLLQSLDRLSAMLALAIVGSAACEEMSWDGMQCSSPPHVGTSHQRQGQVQQRHAIYPAFSPRSVHAA